MIRLFEIENKTVKVTEHCYTIRWLKAIMDKYPDPEVYLPIYAYIFYMSHPGQENPYHNVKFEVREDTILNDLGVTIDTEDDVILKAVENATRMYETPSVRAYKAITTMLDNLSDYMRTAKITAGRDGNITALTKVAKEFDEIRKSYKGVSKDVEAEQQSVVRGGANLAYDQI
jgi:hypothetical protein